MSTREYDLFLDSETDNKLRWNGDVDGVAFKLYQPKHMVPDPVPQRIRVAVDEGAPSASRGFPSRDATGLKAIVEFVSQQTQTVRYRPVGHSRDWIIGEPYIPCSLLPTANPQRVGLIVRWG